MRRPRAGHSLARAVDVKLVSMSTDKYSLNVFLDPANRRAFTTHDRHWAANRYVYPVVSRRSGGISIGVNLNADKICNFDCIYCCVDRRTVGGPSAVDLNILRTELTAMLETVHCGKLYAFEPFSDISPELRRLNDIAFSGDGEPTTCPQFFPACQLAAELLQTRQLADVKIVIITNATMLHRPAVREALAFLDAHNGEIWAKLDAGTQAYYQRVDRSSIPLQRVLDNITASARQRPVVIQTLLMRVHGELPPESEIQAYIQRLADIRAGGGGIKLIQLYTVARHTTEPYATALTPAELKRVGDQITMALPKISVRLFP
ncbi:MAG: radical SAM protein [Phycisphaerae bacterium]